MVTSAPSISAAGSPGCSRCSWDPTVVAATGTPSWAEVRAPLDDEKAFCDRKQLPGEAPGFTDKSDGKSKREPGKHD